MNPLESIANLFRRKRKQQDALQLGREFGENLIKKIEAIPTSRFDEFAVDLLSAFKSILDKISNNSSDDPILVATAELKIFDKEIENYQQAILQDILKYLASDIEIADRLGLHNEVAAMIDKIIEPRHEFLVSGAIHLYKEKVKNASKSDTSSS
jgi:hypothetical protein